MSIPPKALLEPIMGKTLTNLSETEISVPKKSWQKLCATFQTCEDYQDCTVLLFEEVFV